VTAHRRIVPATPDVGWVVAVPTLCAGAALPASPASLHDLETEFAPPQCPGCARFVERAMQALSVALDEVDDEPFRGGPTD